MHVPISIVVPFFLTLIETVSAVPPLNRANDLSLFVPEVYNSTSLQQFHTTTTNLSVADSSPVKQTTCYHNGHRSPLVDLLACFPIIATLARKLDYEKPIRWRILHKEQAVNMRIGGCRLQIINGAKSDVFSVAEVVDAMEAILEECQPEVKSEYAGTGGQKGVGRYGFVVRVVGVKGYQQ